MTIITRFATVEDIPQLEILVRGVLKGEVPTQLYSVEALQKAIKSQHLDLIVADNDGEIVGLARFGTPILEDCDCEDLKLIHALLVHPEWSWDSIIRELLSGVEESLNEDATIQRIAVYVDPSERDLVRFYANSGFHHEEPEDEDGLWYMELDL